ncbi:MAG: hypothetical protein HQL23_07050, partial [Candidatus Omnitrophica bacterium]|nr:hypothetical protein [Candidatus Omnitrophota bacterium]
MPEDQTQQTERGDPWLSVRCLPQAYPFLLIDKVTFFKKGEKIIAVKNITAGEWPLSEAGGRAMFPLALI